MPPGAHTMLDPHEVPAGRGPVSMQLAVPDAQTTIPESHGLVGMHAAPARHAPQVPTAEHTMPDPHAVPAAALPVATQAGAPAVHAVFPVRHDAVGMHAGPGLAMHTEPHTA
jgi:hypothetical protein